MTTIQQLLNSLTDAERDYIAGLDYGADRDKHREALDEVIRGGGIVDFQSQGYWFPYEVIELGKNHLKEGHEREFAACTGTVLLNIEAGGDKSSNIDDFIYRDVLQKLPEGLRIMLEALASQARITCEQVTPVDAEPATRPRRD